MLMTTTDHRTPTDHPAQSISEFGGPIAWDAPNFCPDRRTASRPEIVQAATPKQLAQVKVLMRDFVRWLRIRYQGSLWFINGYFDKQAFEAELDALPGGYAPPSGRLLLAACQGEPAGCVAFRGLGNDACEMKRMYVRSDFQGQRIGQNLVSTLIREARKAGYERMLLDTGCKQFEAQNLYRNLGFTEIKPYYEVSPEQRDMLVFMELRLR